MRCIAMWKIKKSDKENGTKGQRFEYGIVL